MRIWSILGVAWVVGGCDGASRVGDGHANDDGQTERFAAPVALHRWSPAPAPAAVTFAAAETLAAADAFALAGDHVVTVADGVVRLDGVEVTRVSGLVSACAASLDAKGQTEIVVAAGGATVHLARKNSGWVATPVAPFAAAHLAFNARSPRGPELVFGDATQTLVHAVLVDGAFRALALPAGARPGRALAVAVDDQGRSHFAIGADYYGDRGATWAFWPSGAEADGAVAIALDPADDAQRAIQIVHASADHDGATSLFRSVIGPDSAVTTRWAEARAIVGRSEHLAPADGQLAARFDSDGHLHTAAALRVDRALGPSLSLVYDTDRDGAVHHVELSDVRPTGAVALLDDGQVLAADHGALVAATRTSTFPKGEPAEVAEAPSVGAVDVCGGAAAGATTVLRTMTNLSAVAFATGGDDDTVHALEWDLGRGAVRHTVGDAAGWTTTELTPWQLDTMRAGRSRALVDGGGATWAAWPEGDGVAVWSDRSGAWTRVAVDLPAIDDRPSLAEVGGRAAGTMWIAGLAGGTVVAAEADGGVEIVAEHATAQALVAGAAVPTVLFAAPRTDGPSGSEAGAQAGSEIWVARRDPATGTWMTRAVGAAHEVLGLVGVVDGDALVVGVSERTADGTRVRALEARAVTTIRGTWPTNEVPGERALTIDLVGGDAQLVWSDGRALTAVRLGAAITIATLEVAPGATLAAGSATRTGRLVAVERAGDVVRVVAQACR